MNTQQIIKMAQERTAPMTPAGARKVVADIRSDARADVLNVLAGVLAHHRAQSIAREIEIAIADSEATAKTAVARFNKLQQAASAADLAVRKAKADKIMLPGSAPKSAVTAADRSIRDTENALKKSEKNLQGVRSLAQQRQRELENLRAVHRALAAVQLPDTTLIQVLLDAVR